MVKTEHPSWKVSSSNAGTGGSQQIAEVFVLVNHLDCEGGNCFLVNMCKRRRAPFPNIFLNDQQFDQKGFVLVDRRLLVFLQKSIFDSDEAINQKYG